jgi:hypothetical protein
MHNVWPVIRDVTDKRETRTTHFTQHNVTGSDTTVVHCSFTRYRHHLSATTALLALSVSVAPPQATMLSSTRRAAALAQHLTGSHQLPIEVQLYEQFAAAALPLSQATGPAAAAVCGIVGFVAAPDCPGGPAVDYLLDGLRILENRGYDSAGITTIDPSVSLSLSLSRYLSVPLCHCLSCVCFVALVCDDQVC